MARARNHITKLPRPLRKHIARMLDDGATYDEVRNDADVAAACAAAGVELHNTTFLAYRSGHEYDEFTSLFRERDEEMERNAAAACLAQEGASDDLAAAANYELMRLVMARLKDVKDLDPSELKAVSSAVASYNRNRIAEEKEDGKRAAAAKETEYQARIAELSATVAAQAAKIAELAAKAGPADNSLTIAEMDKFVKGDGND